MKKMTYLNINKKVVKKIINFLLVIFTSTFVYAQQVPHYTQYLYNMEVVNPAFVGVKADMSISLLSRQQWVGVDGAPETNTLSVSGRLNEGLGMGATVIHDKIGLAETTNLNIDASYTITTSRYGRLSFGLKGGYTFFNNNLSNGITSDGDVYPSINGGYVNFGFGGVYYNKRFFIGASIPNILKPSTFLTESNINNTGGVSVNNYFLTSGGVINISDDIIFKPTTLIKYSPNLPLSIDLNTNFIYKNKIEAGLSYRYNSSFSALFAIFISKKYRVGYSYDYNLTDFGGNLSSHEIILRFDLKLKRKGRWLLENTCYF